MREEEFLLDLRPGGGELEEIGAIDVLLQEPEEDAPRVHERRRLLVPPVFGQPAEGRDGPDPFEVRGTRRGGGEDRLIPDPVDVGLEGEFDGRTISIREVAPPRRHLTAKPRDLSDGAILHR